MERLFGTVGDRPSVESRHVAPSARPVHRRSRADRRPAGTAFAPSPDCWPRIFVSSRPSANPVALAGTGPRRAECYRYVPFEHVEAERSATASSLLRDGDSILNGRHQASAGERESRRGERWTLVRRETLAVVTQTSMDARPMPDKTNYFSDSEPSYRCSRAARGGRPAHDSLPRRRCPT